MGERTCDVCGGPLGEASAHYHPLQGQSTLPVWTRRGWTRDGLQTPSYTRQHELSICGDCQGGSEFRHFIAGFTQELDRLAQAKGREAARKVWDRMQAAESEAKETPAV